MKLSSKFPGTCSECGDRFPAGTEIEWERGRKEVRHYDPRVCEAVKHTRAAMPKPPVYAVVAEGSLVPIVDFLRTAAERLRFPKVRFLLHDDVTELKLAIAGPNSREPGSLQVVIAGQWVGRINMKGVATAGVANDPVLCAHLEYIAKDAAAAAKRYGVKTGRCSFCNLPLTDAGSVEVGYGPICARNYGLPHSPRGTWVPEPLPVAVGE